MLIPSYDSYGISKVENSKGYDFLSSMQCMSETMKPCNEMYVTNPCICMFLMC